jgi:hypothetical protein
VEDGHNANVFSFDSNLLFSDNYSVC